jgi:biotin synthase
MRNFDVDMVGMGPYIEHADTPLFAERKRLLSLKERFRLSLKMIAILRIMMKDINIAASTAMQTADKLGREKAIKVGANVFMPNITPVLYRQHYRLYDNKSCIEETPEDCLSCISIRIGLTGNELALGEWGDSKHFFLKQKI